MLIVQCPRIMVIFGVSLRLVLEQDSRDSAVKLNPAMDQTITQAPRKENQEGPSVKGKTKCLKRKPPTNPKLLMNFIIWNVRGATVGNLGDIMHKWSNYTNL